MVQKIFVADDWGLSKPINEAILQLVKYGLVGRVSLMTNVPNTEYLLDDLKRYPIDISFHFNLTSGVKSGNKMINFRDLFFGKFERNFVTDQFSSQFQISKQLGMNFSILESHQYIHLIPKIGKILVPLLVENKILQVRSQESILHPAAKLASVWSFSSNYKEQRGFSKAMTTEYLFYRERSKKLVVIHPANSVSSDGSDPWRKKRYHQFLKIKNDFHL